MYSRAACPALLCFKSVCTDNGIMHLAQLCRSASCTPRLLGSVKGCECSLLAPVSALHRDCTGMLRLRDAHSRGKLLTRQPHGHSYRIPEPRHDVLRSAAPAQRLPWLPLGPRPAHSATRCWAAAANSGLRHHPVTRHCPLPGPGEASAASAGSGPGAPPGQSAGCQR